MKKDLATAIVTGILGVIIAYFVTNLLIPSIENFTFTTVDSSLSLGLVEPNNELFNFNALNPTVEVFVGDCTEFGENGECLDEPADTDTNPGIPIDEEDEYYVDDEDYEEIFREEDEEIEDEEGE